jgi:phage-related protein
MAGSKKTVWDLTLNIGGKDDGSAGKALKQIKKQIGDVSGAAKAFGNDFKAFAGNVTKLAATAAAGAAAAVAGIVGTANSIAEAGDKAAKASQAIGIGVEAYQQLHYAMGMAGLSAEELDGALLKYNQTVKTGAAGNSAMQKKLADIGLSAEKLSKMKPEDAFLRLSDYMQSLPTEAAQTRLAIELFGKSAGPKLFAAMKNGSAGITELMREAQSLGIVIDEETAKNSEAYLDMQSKMQQSLGGLKTQFGMTFLPPLTKAFETLQTAISDNLPAVRDLGERVGEWIEKAANDLPGIIERIIEFGTQVKETVEKIVEFAGGWENVAKIAGALALAPTFISGVKTVSSFANLIKVAFSAIGPLITGLGASGAAGFGAIAAAAAPVIAIVAGIAAVGVVIAKNWDKIKAALLQAFGQIKEAAKALILKIAEFWDEHGEKIMAVISVAAGIIEAVIVGLVKIIIKIIANAITVITVIIGIIVDVVSGVINAITAIVEFFIWFFTDGVSGAVEAVKGFFQSLRDKAVEIFDAVKEKIGTVVNFFKNQFTEKVNAVKSIIDGIKTKFTEVFDNIKGKITDFINFFTEKFDKVREGVSNIGSGISSGVNNAVTGVKDFFGGKTAAHAEGGIFRSRHFAEIAEKGPEAVVPLNRTDNGYQIWRQAGELGGYFDAGNGAPRFRDVVNAVSRMAPFPSPVKPPSSLLAAGAASPIARMAGEKLGNAGNLENSITIDFKQNFTINGSPDGETVKKIADSGKRAADDLAARLNEIERQRRRVSYA